MYSNFDTFQGSPVAAGLTALLASLLIFFGYLSYTPRVDKRSPKFTSDTSLFIGSWGFYSRRWSFWKDSVARSKSGHFSFWLNKYHVVGISGESVRKMFLENSDLNRITAAHLHGVGPEIVPPIHPIFRTDSKNAHTYFQRRVLDLMKTGHLESCLPGVVKDARIAFESLDKQASSFFDPIDVCYRLVLTQSARVVSTDEISDNPELMASYLAYTRILQHTSSGHTVTVPWLPSWAHMKRRYCRAGLNSLIGPIVDRRMQNNAQRKDDTLQILIDMGDSADYIKTFFISILFISVGNAGKLAGGLLNLMAQKPEWQERIYREVKEAAAAHSATTKKKKDLPLVDQLGLIPLEAWESAFPSIELCFRESIRMHVAFPMIRQNTGPHALPIPGSNEVIPSGSFVAYNTGDVHYNEKLYPNARKNDPSRFLDDREEHKKESYGFLGWGGGRHRCVGQRWAKLQQNIILAHALALYEWKTCDANGHLVELPEYQIDLDTHGNSLPKGIYLKHVPRTT